MKKYLFAVLAIAAIFCTGCKKQEEPVVDDGTRTISVRIYTTQDMIQYADVNIYYTAYGDSTETKLDLGTPVAIDETTDAQLVKNAKMVGMDASAFKVYVLTAKSKFGGYANFRWDMNLKSGVTVADSAAICNAYKLTCGAVTSTNVSIAPKVAPADYADKLKTYSLAASIKVEQ